MAMAIDSRQQPPLDTMGFDPMRYQAPPQFTNPWGSAPASTQSHMYATSLAATAGDSKPYAAQPQPNAVSAAYAGAHMGAPALPTGILPADPGLFEQAGLLVVQDGVNAPRPYGAPYGSSAAPAGVTFSPAQAAHYAQASYGYPPDRRTSHQHPSVAPTQYSASQTEAQGQRRDSDIDYGNRLTTASEAERQSFSDALDASRGMVAMSQSDVTPRNIYGTNNHAGRSSTDAYGFPSAHSTHSSISSTSGYPGYYPSSVSEASTGEYSGSESVDMPNTRTLPRPNGLLNGSLPPAPQSMMGQFSSKVSSSSQKKHKCKICDKRFTRPSSLQTHMYSHTGEKPFACEVEGCGRHFSVVSNLRRHRKVHRGEAGEDDVADGPSPGEDEE